MECSPALKYQKLGGRREERAGAKGVKNFARCISASLASPVPLNYT